MATGYVLYDSFDEDKENNIHYYSTEKEALEDLMSLENEFASKEEIADGDTSFVAKVLHETSVMPNGSQHGNPAYRIKVRRYNHAQEELDGKDVCEWLESVVEAQNGKTYIRIAKCFKKTTYDVPFEGMRRFVFCPWCGKEIKYIEERDLINEALKEWR